MQSPKLDLCRWSSTIAHQALGFRHTLYTQSLLLPSSLSVSSKFPKRNPKHLTTRCKYNSKGGVKLKGNKDNVWSVDNELAKASSEREKRRDPRRTQKGKRVVRGRRSRAGRILVSGPMLMEDETVLQTQEPVIKPVWNTFASSVSGIWKGVGAVFSPITAKMEPIEVGKKNENLYDCYTISRIEAVTPDSKGQTSQIQRKINWVTFNPYGESQKHIGGSNTSPIRETVDKSHVNPALSKFESFNFGTSDVMEEDVMDNEPGLVFFEDGSYSRGPVDIPVSENDESEYYLSPTLKFEQCLVKGCHKRLRIIHTIEFNNGGSDIQIMRVAVYEEQWVSPANLPDDSDQEFDLKPFSQRKRTQASELTGSWKVFEVSATPIFGEKTETEESDGTPSVYFCTETLKKRMLPENSPVYFGEEEMLDMQDVTILWLPGGVTSYVDVKKDGILCIGVGWYSDEGVNLIMERDYGMDGKLKEVRWKSELKRRWSDPLSV